jgi:hypothetical protein
MQLRMIPLTSSPGHNLVRTLFEAGMAIGHDADRTILVELGNVRPFSDVAGRHVIRMDGGAARRKELANRLETAGCAVNLSHDDWAVKVISRLQQSYCLRHRLESSRRRARFVSHPPVRSV